MTNNDPLRQLALSTETSAVREKFDLHNTRYIRLLALGLLLFSFGALLAYLHRTLLLKAAGAATIFVASILAVLISTGRSKALAQRTAGSRTEWLTSLVFVQFVGFIAISYRRPQDIAIFGTVIVCGLIILWMPFGRRIVIHLLIALVIILAIETTPAPLPMRRAEYYVPTLFSNVVALFIGGFISRRARKRIIAEWSERHAQAVEQLRMRDELALARQVQLSMLPLEPPALAWLDIAASSTPATEVGGDYYDYFPFGSQMAIVCGDVAGHGFASGIVLAALRSGFTLLRDSLGDPARVLIRLHELIEQTSRTRMLTTAAIVSLDPKSRRARIASAGHPPVMFRSNGAVRAIELFGPPLGVRLPISIAQTEVGVGEGDVFVLHTDGLYETVNESGESYGLDRLADVIERAQISDAAALLDAILADVDAFRGDEPQSDDVTVVVAIVR